MGRKVAVIATLLLCLAAIPMYAQTVTGTLEGRVLDRTGAVIPNAQVSIKGDQTGLARDGVTNGEGYFAFRFVPIGTYEVMTKAQGFGSVRKSSVEVALNTTTTSDFTLSPAAVSETVNVTGEAALIETSAADFKNTFETKAIEDRPLPTRNFLYFAETVPGFQENPVSGQNNPTASSGSSVNFNGTGTRGTTFQINGVNNDDSSENQQRQGVNISTIQQVQVMTNNFSAEFGRGYGTVVLVQTKQGTNRFHGDVFWFHLNSWFQSRDWFQNPRIYDPYLKVDSTGKTLCTGSSDPTCQKDYKVPSNRRHDYGGTIGGPILKNKLFFFGSFQQVKSGGGATTRRDVLFPSEHSIPASVTDPKDRAFLQKVLDSYPAATPNDPTYGVRSWRTSYQYHYPDYDYSGRVDWNMNSKNTFTARYQWTHQIRQADQVIAGEGTRQNNHQQNLGLTWSHIFSNTQTGEFRVGLGRRETMVDLQDAPKWTAGAVPIIRVGYTNLPTGVVTGTNTTMGSSGVYPIHRFQTDWQFVYNHYWMVTPKLTLKAGTDVRPAQLNDLSDQFSRGYWILRDQGRAPANPDGTAFTYAQWLADPRCPSHGMNDDCPYKDPYWSLRHGVFGSASGADFQKSLGPASLANNLNEANFYLQADYKVLPSLTIMLGFRDEWVAAAAERAKRIDYGYNDRNYAAPRIGFAYSPNFQSGLLHTITGGPGKMSFHGGYGMFTGRVFQSFFSQNGASVRFMPPYGITPIWNVSGAASTYTPGFFSDPTNGYVYDHTMPTTRWSPIVIDKKLYSPYTEQWNLTMQREVSSSMAVTLAYVGSRGVGLPFYNTLNRTPFPAVGPAAVYSGTANDMIPTSGAYKGVNFSGVVFDCVDPNLLNATPIKDPVTGHQCISLQQPFTTFRRPDARYGGITVIRNGNKSWYNAFQATFKRRLSKGMMWDINYTFGKALDTGSEATYTGLESGSPTTMYDDGRLNKGYSLFDTPQRLTANFTYELPFFKDQVVHQFGDVLGGIAGRVVGGWQLSGTYIKASGTPFGVTAGYDLNADGVNNDRPNLVDPSVMGLSADNPRINPATGLQFGQTVIPQTAFYPNSSTSSANRPWLPGLTNVGSLGRNTFRSNGRNNLDAALQKNFRITEGTKVAFRWEIYNLANHPQFYLPGGLGSYSTSPTNWMKITSTRNNRVDTGTGARYMQFALRYVF